MKRVLVVCLNPTFQKTYMFDSFILGEVNRAKYLREDASGKGINVARVLTQKKIENVILSHLHYKDEKRMVELVKRDNIKLKYVLDSDSRVRTCSTILTKSGQTTELVEESNKVSDSTDKKIRELFNQEIKKCDYLLITGTRSPNYREDIYSTFVKEAKELNKTVILDVAGDELKRCIKFKPDIIKPNLREFMKTFYNEDILENSQNEKFKEKVLSKVKCLYDEYNIISVITRGKSPTWVYDSSGFFQVEVEKSDKCVNTIGCGDTFAASLIANLSDNESLEVALKKASHDALLNAMSIIPGSLI